MRRALICFTLVLLAANAGIAQSKKKGGKRKAADNPEGPVAAGQLASWNGSLPASRASVNNKQSDFPAIAFSADGALWSAYIEWNDKDADRLLLRRRSPQGQWSDPVELADGNWDHYSPTIAGRASSAVVIWSGQKSGNFDLFWSEVNANLQPSRPAPLTSSPHSDINARAVSDSKGNVTVAWQSFRNGNADIYARRLSGSTWLPEILLSDSTASDWDPAIALDSTGKAWISFDSYRHGNYDVFLRSFDGRQSGPLIPITTEPSAQFHSSVAVDPQDRVWVAWDDSGINWGKDFSRSSAVDGSRGLHYSRTLGLRVYHAGRVHSVSSDPASRFTGRMLRYAELPHLAFDSAGALTLVFRHWTYTKPHEIYHFYVTRLAGAEWEVPRQLDSSAGQNTQWASLARRPDGAIETAYSSDGRSEQNVPRDPLHALHYSVYTAVSPKAAAPANPTLTPITLPPPGTPQPKRVRATMSLAGKRYTLMFGDCHRHTDIRGHSSVDGSVIDTYRYAIDAAQLDFLGTADHNNVVPNWPDGLRDYQWWWTQKAVDLFTHAPSFTGIYSYEHSMSRPAGHRNVLFSKRGAPLRNIDRSKDPDNQPPALWEWWRNNVLTQPGQKTVIVPHTFGAGPIADFNWPNARFDCLLEMYQGARGSYEAWRLPDNEKRGPTQVDEDGHFARNALANGNTYGFVSFSDHGSTHNSWAGVWVEQTNRDGVLDGMYARRTYAASDEIILKVTSGAHMPGEEWNGTQPPTIDAIIDAPDQILRIDVVKDGKYVYTTRPNSRQAKLNWRDTETKPGRSYYYVRVFQRDPEAPDGDPEIAWSSPFYITYR